MKEVKEISETINEIVSICQSYYELPKDYSCINDLIYKRQRLSGLFFFLSFRKGDINKDVEISKVEYENELSALRIAYHSNGAQGNKIASHKSSDLRKIYSLNLSIKERLKEVIYGAKEVLSALNQQISILSKEEQYQKFLK